MQKLLPFIFICAFIQGKTQTELVDFESTPVNVSIDSLIGCWQIGTPSKTLFDTAYSSTRALMTDTLNNYTDGTISYAYFTFPSGNLSSSYTLSFKHRYNTELNTDGGYLEYFDCFNGTWENIIGSSGLVCPAYFVYYMQTVPTTFLFNGETGFSGNNTGWEETQIGFGCGILFNPDQNRGSYPDAQFRFVFVSDGNNTNQEGWMIDDILWTDFSGYCGSIEKQNEQMILSVYPTLTDGKINFETENQNFSQITIYDFSGNQIETFNFSQTNYKTIQLNNLANGMYFYSVDEGMAMGKFIIEK